MTTPNANGSNSAGSDNTADEKLMLAQDGTTPTTPSVEFKQTNSGLGSCSPPCRLVFALMGFFCFFNLYALRVDLSVALVSMVNITYNKELEAELSLLSNATVRTDDLVCEFEDPNVTAVVEHRDGPFKWDTKQQGIVLGSFFYGYIFTQLPGGLLAERFGGKLVLLVGIAWTALLTLLTPIIAEVGDFAGIITLRILEGFGSGVAFPAMHVMLSNWAPPLERGRMATFIYAGAQIGTVVAMPVSGVLCHYVSWQSVFYIFGALGMAWSVMWIFLVYDKPSTHPRISIEERQYIESSQGPLQSKQGAKMKIPWLKMAKSPAVYALMMGNFAHNWGNFFLLTVSPQFLRYILKFNIQSSGAVAGAPYLTMWFGMLLGGTITDFIISRRLMTVTYVRKLFVIVGLGGPAVCIVATGYVNCATALAVVFLVTCGLLLGLSWGGWGVNHLDIAPPFAGTLFGITNCISTIPGFVAPAIVGALTFRNQTRQAWRSAFYITGAVHIFGTIVFLIFGTGVRQKWSIPETKEDAETALPLKLETNEEEEKAGKRKSANDANSK